MKRLALWALALGLCALFVRAGLWQAGRATEKETQLASVGDVLAVRAPIPLAEASGRMPAWVDLEGRFVDAPPLRLDNQRRGERVGVHVYRAFETVDGWRLWVDLGWRPLPADRRLPEESPLPATPIRLAGLLVPPPSAGLPLGPAMAPAPDGGWLALRLPPEAMAAAWRRPEAATASAPPLDERRLDGAVLRLDPLVRIGYERDLDLLANTLSPDKHRGYALQWFGFATGLFLLSLYLQFRRP